MSTPQLRLFQVFILLALIINSASHQHLPSSSPPGYTAVSILYLFSFRPGTCRVAGLCGFLFGLCWFLLCPVLHATGFSDHSSASRVTTPPRAVSWGGRQCFAARSAVRSRGRVLSSSFSHCQNLIGDKK